VNYSRYTVEMQGYSRAITSREPPFGILGAPPMPCACQNLDGAVASSCVPPSASEGGCPGSQITMEHVDSALRKLLDVSQAVEYERRRLNDNLDVAKARDLNDRLLMAERALCTREGLRDR
jgi:hypothetical protein